VRKIVAVGGEPGTGKTTLMRLFMEGYDWKPVEEEKLVSAMYCEELDLYVLGKYEENEVFAGTDRLSMAVQPNAVKFVKETKSNIIFEGDRIFNQSFLEFLVEQPDTEVDIVYLQTCDTSLKERYAQRGSNQSETFLRGRRTKYQNLLTNFILMGHTSVFSNENTEDQNVVLTFLNKRLK
jgi:broad-specificity NMP kinase